MKKHLAFVLSLCLLLNLCGCQQQSTQESSAPVTEVPPIAETPLDGSEPLPAVLDSAYWQEHLPTMDGSTSLIPLEAGIRSALFGISMEEATTQVTHSSTYNSFYNLLNKDADLIFSVPLSEAQLQTASDRGITMEQVAVAKEGFVFVVNAKNPVNSLTQQQLKDIYSGKITNWSEVGGNNEEIIAYQRNNDSGSQNYMISFMGEDTLMNAPSEKRPSTMAGLMDVIAVNDYAEQSIGYSVYAYAADMYGNGNEIKFIAVDGVAPSKATMASGEYPLLSDNYAIFRGEESEYSPVRLLVDWLISDEGQLAVAQAGYVTLRDIGFDYEEVSIAAAYSGIGSGYVQEWAPAALVSTAVKKPSRQWDNPTTLPLEITFPENHNNISNSYTEGLTYTLNCLTNKELEAKINTFLAEAVSRADAESVNLEQYIQTQNRGLNWERYSLSRDWNNSPALDNSYPSAIVSVEAKNGYIWATVTQRYIDEVNVGYDKYYRTECKTWDLFSGEELTTEDLFLNGLNVADYLNDFMHNAALSPIDSWRTMPALYEDFTHLTQDGWAICPNAIYVDSGKLGFVHGLKFDFTNEDSVLCTSIYRDMSGCFDDSKVNILTLLAIDPYQNQFSYVQDEFFSVELLNESVGNTEIRKAINDDFLKQISGINRETALAYFQEKNSNVTEGDLYAMYDWALTEYGGRFAVFQGPKQFDIYVDNHSYVWYPQPSLLIYDLQTGELLQWSDLLNDSWQDDCVVRCWNKNNNAFTFDGDYSILQTADSFYQNYGIYQTIGRNNQSCPIGFSFTDSDGNIYEVNLPYSALKHFN